MIKKNYFKQRSAIKEKPTVEKLPVPETPEDKPDKELTKKKEEAPRPKNRKRGLYQEPSPEELKKLTEKATRREDLWQNSECLSFVCNQLGIYRSPEEIIKATDPVPDNEKPEPGDVIIYYKKNRPIHWGICLGENRVISKWGTGDVFEHQQNKIPYNATKVKYLKPKKKK